MDGVNIYSELPQCMKGVLIIKKSEQYGYSRVNSTVGYC
jgi:hypothetical protein